MPTSHKIHPPPPSFTEKHPLWSPNGCQFLRQPTADPFRPGNCRPAKEPKSPGASISFLFFPPPDSKMALLAARSGLGKEGGETRGESSEERERDGEKVLKFAFLIWSPRHFTLLQDLKSPLIPPHLPLDFFLKWQGFPQNSCSPDGRTEATSHAADSHVSWQLTLSQSCDQFDLFVLTKGRTRSHENPPPPKKQVPSWLSSFICPPLGFASSLIGPQIWAVGSVSLPLGPVWKIFFLLSIGTNPGQSSHSMVESKTREKRGRKRRDSGGIAGLKFQLWTAVVSSEGQRDFLDGGVLMAWC